MPEIGNSAKTIGFVDMSNAYIPSVMAGFVHRREFLREVLAFLNSPDGDALFVTGPTGSGKTSGILQILARSTGLHNKSPATARWNCVTWLGTMPWSLKSRVKPHP